MTREETIKALMILKEQALKSHNDTAVIDVKKDSFVFVIQSAIKALEQEPIYYPPCEDCRNKMNEIRRVYDRIQEVR